MVKVVVGMSGGVDSSVAASVLIEQGYEVIGLFMKNWEEDDDEKYCTAADDLDDAQSVCDELGIPLKTINFSSEYWDRVFSVFLKEYKSGRTPNPDIICNKEIKFNEFIKWSHELGAEKIATGHYAKIKQKKRGLALLKGDDETKDQSYFLYALNQYSLQSSMFPLGEMQKKEVRQKAKAYNFRNHDKKDSTGICFIGERKFTNFMTRFLPRKPGVIKTLDGDNIGEHMGAHYYTIGQRYGLGIGGDGAPWYVVRKDIKLNILFVAQGKEHRSLWSNTVVARKTEWIAGHPPAAPCACHAKIRYQQKEQSCNIVSIGADYVRVEFDSPQWAQAPGQSIVFYCGNECIGGGIIEESEVC